MPVKWLEQPPGSSCCSQRPRRKLVRQRSVDVAAKHARFDVCPLLCIACKAALEAFEAWESTEVSCALCIILQRQAAGAGVCQRPLL